MPTRAGVPLIPRATKPVPQDPGPFYVGNMHPYPWNDLDPNDETSGLSQAAMTRGHPMPLSWWQQRMVRGPQTIPQAAPYYTTSRPYSRGADAHAPTFGQLSYNPIGAGIYGPYRLPTIAGPGARYQNSAIWFDVQTIGTSLRINPTIPIETVNALIAISHVGPSYPTTG